MKPYGGFRIICAALLLLLVQPLSSRAQSNVDAILAGLRQASTCDAWHRLAIVELRGTRESDGMQGPFLTRLDARDGRYVTSWQSGDLSSADGFDGVAPWSQDYSAGTNVMNASSAKALAITQAWIDARGWCEPEPTVNYWNGGTAGGRRGLDAIAARPAGGAPVTLFVDRSTHLIEHTLLQFEENHLATYYYDWRSVAGAAVPFGVRIDDPEDGSSQTSRLTSFRTVGITPSFVPPPTAENITLPTNASFVRVPYVVEGSKPLIEVTINGKGPFPFVVDSGGHFILSEQTARAVGLHGRGSASSTNQGKVSKVRFTHVDRVQVGGAVLHDEVAEINPYGYTKLERGPRAPKAGWLGLEFFERFAVTFDPTTQKMTLRPLTKNRPRPAGTRLPLTFIEDAPLTDCHIAGKPGICMVDTGNAGPTIVANAWAQRNGITATLSRGVDMGGWVGRRATVAIGPFERPGAIVSYTPASMGDPEPYAVEAGVLNEDLINGFISTFDYATNSLWLKPAGQYTAPPFNRSGIFATKTAQGPFIVRYVVQDSPAMQAGIVKGDIIWSVNGIPASQLSGADFAALNASQKRELSYVVVRGTSRRTLTLHLRDLLP